MVTENSGSFSILLMGVKDSIKTELVCDKMHPSAPLLNIVHWKISCFLKRLLLTVDCITQRFKMSITQTIVEQRLQPPVSIAPQPNSKATKPPLPSVLLRSSSFDRLKQFPSSLHAYFCRHGSVELIKWLTYSRTQIYSTVSQILHQLRSYLLITSVYAALGLVSIQLVMCILTLATISLPNGLAFLLTCILAMAAIGIKLNLRRTPQLQQRRSRSRTRHVKQE